MCMNKLKLEEAFDADLGDGLDANLGERGFGPLKYPKHTPG